MVRGHERCKALLHQLLQLSVLDLQFLVGIFVVVSLFEDVKVKLDSSLISLYRAHGSVRRVW